MNLYHRKKENGRTGLDTGSLFIVGLQRKPSALSVLGPACPSTPPPEKDTTKK